MATIPSGGGGGGVSGGSGWIKISDLSVPGGTATSKVFQDTPGDTILQSVEASSNSVEVTILSSFPLIDFNGDSHTLPPAADEGHYEDTISATLTGSGSYLVACMTPDDSIGAQDTVDVTVTLPAELTGLSFSGTYPGAQTELAENNTFSLDWTSDNPIDALQIENFGALKSELITFPSATSGTATVTIDDEGDVLQTLSGRASPRDAASGAFGAILDTNVGGGNVDGVDVLEVNNLHPTNVWGSPSYPGAQTALKASEQASVNFSIANADSVVFDSPNSQISITNPATIETPKLCDRIAGDYNVSTNNIRSIATRNANGTTTTSQRVVNIVNVAPTVTVTEATARVRSGVSPGADTTITITSNQQLSAAPTLAAAASRGTFQGSWAGGPSAWTRALRVPDSENPATGALNSWTGLVATGLSGIVQNSIDMGGANDDTYVVGGFTSRTINFAPGTANSTETFPLTTEGNLSAGSFSNGNPAVVQPFGTADTTDIGKEGWCAPTAASGTAVQMRMLHSPTVAANAAGLTLTLVQETP